MSCHSSCNQTCHARRRRRSHRSWWRRWRRQGSPTPALKSTGDFPTVALVGTPNVGKSVLFNALTGTYVDVSNYPGTTVEVSWGTADLGDRTVKIVDTPGMYSLLPITEEEQVTRSLLAQQAADLVVHVVDAKNLGRMLPLTLQLLEAGFPVMLVLNMIDEARQLNIHIDPAHLEETLGIPVVMTAAALNIGIRDLKVRMALHVQSRVVPATY